ncbi:MAG: hypothetical protein ACI8R8_003435 [Paraglaciecola sp.]
MAVNTGMFTNNKAILLNRALQRRFASFFYANKVHCATEQKHIDEYQPNVKFIYTGKKKQAINLLDVISIIHASAFDSGWASGNLCDWVTTESKKE